jgi:hypothetical protein
MLVARSGGRRGKRADRVGGLASGPVNAGGEYVLRHFHQPSAAAGLLATRYAKRVAYYRGKIIGASLVLWLRTDLHVTARSAAGAVSREVHVRNWAETFGKATFGKATFGKATFGKATFGKATFGKATFGKATFGKATFGKAMFGKAMFGKAMFGKAMFSKAMFSKAMFSKAR